MPSFYNHFNLYCSKLTNSISVSDIFFELWEFFITKTLRENIVFICRVEMYWTYNSLIQWKSAVLFLCCNFFPLSPACFAFFILVLNYKIFFFSFFNPSVRLSLKDKMTEIIKSSQCQKRRDTVTMTAAV